MFKFNALVAMCLIVATAEAGLIGHSHHHREEPVIAHVGEVIHGAPLAVSHQSITQVHHGHTVVHPAPVHVAPVHVAPVHVAPVVRTVHSIVPAVRSHIEHVPVHHHHVAPLAHSAPLLKSYVAAPAVYSHHHY